VQNTKQVHLLIPEEAPKPPLRRNRPCADTGARTISALLTLGFEKWLTNHMVVSQVPVLNALKMRKIIELSMLWIRQLFALCSSAFENPRFRIWLTNQSPE
jgi:hypothetical protein